MSGLTPTSRRACTACRLLTPGTQSPASPRAWHRLLQAPTSWLPVMIYHPLLQALSTRLCHWALHTGCLVVVAGGSNGAGGTPGEGYEGTVGSYIQQHQVQLALQQQSQLQHLQQLHHYQQQQFLQYQQQQQVCESDFYKALHCFSYKHSGRCIRHVGTRDKFLSKKWMYPLFIHQMVSALLIEAWSLVLGSSPAWVSENRFNKGVGQTKTTNRGYLMLIR